jgi:hypothetical protein
VTCCISLLLKNATARAHATWGISPIPLWKKTQQFNAYGVTKVDPHGETLNKSNLNNYLQILVGNGCGQTLRFFPCNHTMWKGL